MITIDPLVIYIVLLVVLAALLISAGALWILRQTNKDVKDGTPPDVVLGILGFADTVAKLALPASALTETLTDDELLIKFLTSRGYTVNGNPEIGYTITPPAAE